MADSNSNTNNQCKGLTTTEKGAHTYLATNIGTILAHRLQEAPSEIMNTTMMTTITTTTPVTTEATITATPTTTGVDKTEEIGNGNRTDTDNKILSLAENNVNDNSKTNSEIINTNPGSNNKVDNIVITKIMGLNVCGFRSKINYGVFR